MKNGRFEERGDVFWLKDGVLHREDGPAIERANGTKEWFFHGIRHREDGPAVERITGERLWWQEWWLSGTCYTEADYTHQIDLIKLNGSLETTLEVKSEKRQHKI